MKTTPYSRALTGGVGNTRVQAVDDTLEGFAKEFAKPILLDVTAKDYHALTKREQGAYKMHLPYFVGGEVDGRRHDSNVTSRTLLTLDVEQGKNDESPPPSPEHVAGILESLGGAGWIYTSVSHTAQSPRYRVVLPLGRPIPGDASDATAQLQASTQAAADKLGIKEWTKPESWVLSQPMYLPAKLKGGTFYQSRHQGKAWQVTAPGVHSEGAASRKVHGKPEDKALADIPEERPDFLLLAIKAAGLYLNENPKHRGMHYIVCPFIDQHGTENDSQTVYYEAHHDGNPNPAVKCFDTEPDDDAPHLTIGTLTRYLRKNGFLSAAEQEQGGILDDDETFLEKANIIGFTTTVPEPRVWAFRDWAPVGKVTVLAGPGGVSKSMLVLHSLLYGAIGKSFGPFQSDKPLRSLYVSYEDDRQEMHKRVNSLVNAVCEHDEGVDALLYDVKGMLEKNLLMYAADDDASQWLILTKPDRFMPPERTARVQWLINFLKRNKVRMLVLDPAVYTHQLEENNIADMSMFMQTLTAIAKQAQCAVMVIHHMGKNALWATLDEINQGSLRGASSLADNARSVGVVVSMPLKDAESYGLPAEHATSSKYAVFKHAKHNYSASMGIHVFERRGPLLMPRPDIQKLDSIQLKEARQRQVEQDDEARTLSSALAVLRYMRTEQDFVSLTQISTNSHIHKRRIRECMDDYAQRDWVEMEPGERGSTLARITKHGLDYLRQQELEGE